MNRARVKADLVTNIILASLVAVVSLFVVRGAARALPAMLLGAFLFARRVADTSSSLLQLGTAFVIRRAVARDPDADRRLTFAVVGSLVLGAVALALAIVMLTCTPWLARFFFPTLTEGEAIARWLCVITIGLIFHYFAISLLFAQRRIITANALQLANTGGWLLAGLWKWGPSADVVRLLRLQGIASTSLCVAVILIAIAQFAYHGGHFRWPFVSDVLGEYISFGLPRAISPFGEMLIFLVGPWLLRSNLAEAGYLLIAISLIRMVQVCIQPASNIIGIVSATLSGTGEQLRIHRGLRLLLGSLGAAGCVVAVLVFPWLEALLRVWLRDPSVVRGVTPYARVLVLTIPAFAVFQGLKEPIEMLWHAPRNLATIAIGLMALLITYYGCAPLLGPIRAIFVAYTAAFCVIGFTTIVWIREALPEPGYFGARRFLLVLLMVGAANAGLARAVAIPANGFAVLVPLAAMTASALIVLALTLIHRPSAFAQDITAFVRR